MTPLYCWTPGQLIEASHPQTTYPQSKWFEGWVGPLGEVPSLFLELSIEKYRECQHGMGGTFQGSQGGTFRGKKWDLWGKLSLSYLP